MNQFKPKVLLLLFFCIHNLTIAQIQNQPPTFSKINFTYQKKSNFILTDTGFYADTLLIKKYFPEIVFPQDDKNQQLSKLTGFIPFKELSIKNKQKLIQLLSHDNVFIKGVYDVKKNKVKLFKYHEFFELENNESKIIRNARSPHLYKITFNYKKNDTEVKVNSINGRIIKNVANNIIEWKNKEQGIGIHSKKEIDKKEYKWIYEFGMDLPKYVNPYSIFANSEYGVKNIDALEHHYRLLSVSYE